MKAEEFLIKVMPDHMAESIRLKQRIVIGAGTIIELMEEYTQSKLPSEDEIKEAVAKHEDDWYFKYVNEDFEAGVEWVIDKMGLK